MLSDNAVPGYLQNIYELLKCAFPKVVNETEYWPTLAILHRVRSFWTLADVLSVLSNRNRSEVYNDASGFGLDSSPAASEMEKVKRKLDACGYEDWFKKNMARG